MGLGVFLLAGEEEGGDDLGGGRDHAAGDEDAAADCEALEAEKGGSVMVGEGRGEERHGSLEWL